MIAEHIQLQTLARRYPRFFRLETLDTVPTREGREPILRFSLHDHETVGERPVPVLGLFAGVHGLEFIGVQILVHFLDFALRQTEWNHQFRDLLTKVRLVGIPIVNPCGLVHATRSNGHGVDLMRNAPVESPCPNWFIGGHRFSRLLPYYRGGDSLELESQLLLNTVREHCFSAPFSLTLDLHSGFGVRDFLWTPYAKQQGLPPTWEDYGRIAQVIESSLKYAKYDLAPQSRYYCTSGDLWDYLYDAHLADYPDRAGRFLPLTLEVGTWRVHQKIPADRLSDLELFQPGARPPFSPGGTSSHPFAEPVGSDYRQLAGPCLPYFRRGTIERGTASLARILLPSPVSLKSRMAAPRGVGCDQQTQDCSSHKP